jgi:hypothetical protein
LSRLFFPRGICQKQLEAIVLTSQLLEMVIIVVKNKKLAPKSLKGKAGE